MSLRKHRIGLIAEGPTGLSALESLLDSFEVAFVIRTGGSDDEVVKLARSTGVDVVQCTKVSEIESILALYQPELTTLSSFSRILPEKLVLKWDFINVHYAPLPAYRGRANVNWAILNGEPTTAITIHRIVAGLDAGPVLVQQSVAIGPRDNVTDLYNALNDLQKTALPEAVFLRLSGELGTPQDESRASYTCTRLPEDGLVDWSSTSEQIDRLVRALTSPYPGAYTYYGLRKVEIRRAYPIEDPPEYVGRIPGRIIQVNRAEGWVDVLTGDGVVRLLELAVDGLPVAAATVARSVKSTFGVRIDGLIDRVSLASRAGSPSMDNGAAEFNASKGALPGAESDRPSNLEEEVR